MQKKKYIPKFFMGCLVLTVLLLCGCAKKSDLVIETAPKEGAGETAGSGDVWQDEATQVAADQEEDSQTATIFVQVTGAVAVPGVYELPAGARVFEAVQMAGGVTEDAVAESLNQALRLSDGQMVVVMTRQEWSERQADDGTGKGVSETDMADDGRVNINTASLEELCAISGIGQTRAQSIVTYREEHGAFGSIEEIMNVSGIKDGLFQKIKDKIKV